MGKRKKTYGWEAGFVVHKPSGRKVARLNERKTMWGGKPGFERNLNLVSTATESEAKVVNSRHWTGFCEGRASGLCAALEKALGQGG